MVEGAVFGESAEGIRLMEWLGAAVVAFAEAP